jgi:hypothetical protein
MGSFIGCKRRREARQLIDQILNGKVMVHLIKSDNSLLFLLYEFQ